MLHDDLNYPWRLDEISGRARHYSKLAAKAPLAYKTRLKFLGGYTSDFVSDWAKIFGAHYGIDVEVEPALWGTALQEVAVTDPASSSAAIFICFNFPQDLRPLVFDNSLDLDGMKAQLSSFAEQVTASSKELVLVLYDAVGLSLPGVGPSNTLAAAMSALNLHMIAIAVGNPNVRVLDFSILRAALPATAFYDHRNWYSFGQPLTAEASVVLGHQLAVIARGSCGKSKKVLVLDLDNTLWGGVVGDDGVSMLQLGDETAQGRVHADLQRLALKLKQRGVILATASRNNAELALPGFKHPSTVLRETDFAVHEIHWQSKSTSLASIASKLNLGRDSLVFLDDNPAERAEVRSVLPEVLVPDVGENPVDFLIALTLLDPFDITRQLTSEDLTRAEAYAIEGQRQAAAQSLSAADFLRSLETTVRIFKPSKDNFPRIVQLINKTNQFNLTTQRLNEAELHAYLASPGNAVWAVTIGDRFGKHGLTSVLLFNCVGHAARIDNWVMSCRVFNKTAEDAIAATLVRYLKEIGVRTINAQVIPSAKNGVIADLFARLGFSQTGTGSHNGSTQWTLEITLDAAEYITHFCKVNFDE